MPLCTVSQKHQIVWAFFQNEVLKYLNKCAQESGSKSSSNSAKSKSSNQIKIYSKIQRCVWNPVENFSFFLLNFKKSFIVNVQLDPEYPHLWSWWWRHQNNVNHLVLVGGDGNNSSRKILSWSSKVICQQALIRL